MSKQNRTTGRQCTAVFGSDVLLKHPELLTEAGKSAHANIALQIPKQNESDGNIIAGEFQEEPVLLGDCRFATTLDEVRKLACIRDSPESSSSDARHAAEALRLLASATRAGKVNIVPVPNLAYPRSTWYETRYVYITNKPDLLIRAGEDGILSTPLHLPRPPVYTGIRYFVAPEELCDKLRVDRKFSLADFEAAFPDEPKLLPNEYVVLYPAIYDATPRRVAADDNVCEIYLDRWHYSNHIGRYHADEQCIKALCYLDPHDLTIPARNPALAAYYDALRDPDIDTIVVTGPAGSGKTYTAFNEARLACISGQYLHVIVLKEGKSLIGAIKGGVEDKMSPMVEFAKDALRSAEISTHDIDKELEKQAKYSTPPHGGNQPRSLHDQVEDTVALQWSRNFTSVPYEYAQGRTFSHMVVILDEAQRIDVGQMDTLITRQGHGSKTIIMGDMAQLPGGKSAAENSGLPYACKLIEGAPHSARIDLTTVLRSSSVASIIENRERVRRDLGLPI